MSSRGTFFPYVRTPCISPQSPAREIAKEVYAFEATQKPAKTSPSCTWWKKEDFENYEHTQANNDVDHALCSTPDPVETTRVKTNPDKPVMLVPPECHNCSWVESIKKTRYYVNDLNSYFIPRYEKLKKNPMNMPDDYLFMLSPELNDLLGRIQPHLTNLYCHNDFCGNIPRCDWPCGRAYCLASGVLRFMSELTIMTAKCLKLKTLELDQVKNKCNAVVNDCWMLEKKLLRKPRKHAVTSTSHVQFRGGSHRKTDPQIGLCVVVVAFVLGYVVGVSHTERWLAMGNRWMRLLAEPPALRYLCPQ